MIGIEQHRNQKAEKMEIKEYEELVKACQKLIIRQGKEIEALRKLIDDINKEELVSWDDLFKIKKQEEWE